MNPIASSIIILGALLLSAGGVLLTLRKRAVAIGIALLGLGVIATPVVVTWWLAR